MATRFAESSNKKWVLKSILNIKHYTLSLVCDLTRLCEVVHMWGGWAEHNWNTLSSVCTELILQWVQTGKLHMSHLNWWQRCIFHSESLNFNLSTSIHSLESRQSRSSQQCVCVCICKVHNNGFNEVLKGALQVNKWKHPIQLAFALPVGWQFKTWRTYKKLSNLKVDALFFFTCQWRQFLNCWFHPARSLTLDRLKRNE